MTPKTTIIAINCQSCGGAIGIECEVGSSPDAEQTVRFACPYCEFPREVSAPGRVLRIAALRDNSGPAILN